MLALLIPWQVIGSLKTHGTSWREAYENFFELAGQHEKNVLAGVQYYYECKSAAAAQREDVDGEEYTPDGALDKEQDANQIVEGADEMDDENENAPITLTEDDLRAYEESQKSH